MSSMVAERPVETGPLSVFAVCECCGQAVVSHDGKRGWRHQMTGSYRCPNLNGWATPTSVDDMEREVDEACAEAEEIGRKSGYDDGYAEGHREGHEAGVDEGMAQGRRDMLEELSEALDGCLDRVAGNRSLVALDEVREALSAVWQEVTA